MVSLVFRLLSAAALGICGGPYAQWTSRLAIFFAAFAVLSFLLERRSLAKPWLQYVWTATELGSIGYAIDHFHVIDLFAFTLCLPLLTLSIQNPRLRMLLAPLAGGVVAFASLAAKPEVPLFAVGVHAIAATLLTLIMRPFASRERETSVETPLQHPAVQATQDESIYRNYLELRERFRALKELGQKLESNAKIDKIKLSLFKAALGTETDSHKMLFKRLRDLLQVDGLAYYSHNHVGDNLVVDTITGDVPTPLQTRSFPIRSSFSDASLREHFQSWANSLVNESNRATQHSIILRDRNRLQGVLYLTDQRSNRLDSAVATCNEVLPLLAEVIRSEKEQTELSKRLREAELLYAVASVSLGSTSEVSLATRIIRELWGYLDLDHLAIHAIDGDSAMCIAEEGAHVDLVPHLIFTNGNGVPGWLDSRAPEVNLVDTGQTALLDNRVALQKRVGCFLMLPIPLGTDSYGFLTASTHRTRGIDIPQQESLRTIVAEFSQALARIKSDAGLMGIVTPREFQSEVSTREAGYFVYLEPLKRDHIVAENGEVAFDFAIKSFARRLRATMPAGSLLCRREHGDYIAFLQGCDEEFARSWANEATVLASMTPIQTPDGRAQIPLAFRAKVRAYSHQTGDLQKT